MYSMFFFWLYLKDRGGIGRTFMGGIEEFWILFLQSWYCWNNDRWICYSLPSLKFHSGVSFPSLANVFNLRRSGQLVAGWNIFQIFHQVWMFALHSIFISGYIISLSTSLFLKVDSRQKYCLDIYVIIVQEKNEC